MPDLRVGMQSAPRVIEIHVPLRVEAAVVRLTERIEDGRAGVFGIPLEKVSVCALHRLILVAISETENGHEATKPRNHETISTTKTRKAPNSWVFVSFVVQRKATKAQKHETTSTT